MLWLLTWPAATEKIRLYHATAEVTAWAATGEALAAMHRNVFTEAADADIATDEVTGEPKPPSNEPETLMPALEAIITWPDERAEAFTLVHAEQFDPKVMTLRGSAARVYRIVTEHRDLPEELSTNDPALARLQSEDDPRLRSGGVTLFGVQLSLAQFFSSVGLLLAAVAFAMIGPLMALRSAGSRAHGQSWVFVVPGSRRGGRRLLDWITTAITSVWTIAPVAILALQLQSGADLKGLTTGWLFGAGALGLVFSTIVFAMVSVELRRVRTE